MGTTMIGIAALEKDGRMEEARKLKIELDKNEEEIATKPHIAYCNFQDDDSSPDNSLYHALRDGPTAKAGSDANRRFNEAREFFLHLSCCHTVTVEEHKGKTHLSASSPDEQALVSGATNFGFNFVTNEVRPGDGIFKVIHVGDPRPNAEPEKDGLPEERYVETRYSSMLNGFIRY